MEQVFKEFVKPELIILIPVLYIIGIGLKASTVKDKWIPIALGTLGILLSLVYVIATSDLTGVKNLLMAVFTAVTQGVLVAGCSVYFNQIYKQSKKGE